MKLDKSSYFDRFVRNIKLNKSFTLTGLTSFSRLLLVKYIQKISGKKVLFITATEQSALRYSVDLEKIWDISSSILPYQNTSPYETIMGNVYDYQKQVDILRKSPDLIIAPVKVLTERFPQRDFFIDNSLKLKIGDNISQQNLLKTLKCS